MKNEKPASSKAWKSRIEACRTKRKKLVDGPWKDSVNYRKMKPFGAESEQDRIAVPIDWSFTKAKTAQLFSQVPPVQLLPKNPAYAQAVPVFAKELNEVIQNEARVGVAIEEALNDAVNASGIGAVMVGYTATFEDVEVPAIDISMLPPAQMQMLLASGQIPMQKVPRTVSEKFTASRISPANLIWDTSFKGSDFDDSSFIGHEGALIAAQATRVFKLTPEQLEKAVGTEEADSLNDDINSAEGGVEKTVKFTEIFYKAADFDSDELYLDKIKRIVFVDGIEKPVIHEDLEWQKFDEESKTYIGVCKFPIRILTLTYISDEAIPPSDSEVGRPQVDETIKSRSQMVLQRDRSIPIRGYNPDKIDPMVAANLQKGNWNGFIPVAGPNGSTAVWEVARAMYPHEDWEFARVTRSDLQEAWQVGANQTGQFASGERSASEAAIVQQNFATRVGVEKGKVAKFFCSIAETLAGLMQLYYDKPNEVPLVGEADVQRIDQVWDRSKVAGAKFVFTIVPDSMVLLDATQKVDRLMKFINLTGKSGFVNVEPIIAEIAALSGLDPSMVMTKPNPPQPEGANISLRLNGGEDLNNPLVVAMLLKEGRMPGEQEIQAAKLLLADVQAPPLQAPVQASPEAPVGVPEDWGPMERVTKRVDELGG